MDGQDRREADPGNEAASQGRAEQAGHRQATRGQPHLGHPVATFQEALLERLLCTTLARSLG